MWNYILLPDYNNQFTRYICQFYYAMIMHKCNTYLQSYVAHEDHPSYLFTNNTYKLHMRIGLVE